MGATFVRMLKVQLSMIDKTEKDGSVIAEIKWAFVAFHVNHVTDAYEIYLWSEKKIYDNVTEAEEVGNTGKLFFQKVGWSHKFLFKESREREKRKDMYAQHINRAQWLTLTIE